MFLTLSVAAPVGHRETACELRRLKWTHDIPFDEARTRVDAVAAYMWPEPKLRGIQTGAAADSAAASVAAAADSVSATASPPTIAVTVPASVVGMKRSVQLIDRPSPKRQRLGGIRIIHLRIAASGSLWPHWFALIR